MKRVRVMFLIIIAVIMVSCENEDLNRNEKIHQNGISLEYTIGDPISAITRATIENQAGEDKINSLYMMFFENPAEGNGMFLEVIDLKPLAGGSLDITGKIQFYLPENSKLNGSTDYKILFCANIEDYSMLQNAEDIQNQFDGYTENEVSKYLLLSIQGVSSGQNEEIDNSSLIKSSNLPMTASAVKSARKADVSVELIRTVSRFDVFSQARGYELVSASIWNAHTVGTPFGEPTYDYDRTERYYGAYANEYKQILGSLYAFENFVEEPEQGDKNTTCLIIGLKEEVSGQTEYFRVNINADFMGQDLKRNNVYRSTVREVLGQGAYTEREAYEETDLLLDIDINGWMLEDNGNFYHDGTNILALPTKLIELFPYGDEREYNVYTLGEGSPTISYKELPDNITAELIGNRLKIVATSSDEFKEGIIRITFGKLTGSILIRQTPLDRDFIDLSINKLSAFSHEAGDMSEAIQVTGSGRWVAEIYDGDYFAFSSENGPLAMMEGASGDSFNLETIKENSDYDSQYCFVVVRLEDVPEVSRVILLEQKGNDPRYIRFNYEKLNVKTAGGSTDVFTIESNSTWNAEIIIVQGTRAGFNSSYTTQTLSGTNDKTGNRIYLPAHYGAVPTQIIVKATIVDSEHSAELLVYQDPYYTGSLFIVDGTGGSNLVNTSAGDYYYLVYNLGENMRNTSFFGPQGSLVNMPDGGFSFMTSTNVNIIEEARIIQLVTSNLSQENFDKYYESYKEDPSKLLIFSSHSYFPVLYKLGMLQSKANLGYGDVVTVRNQTGDYRNFYPKGTNLQHPLIQYLLDGPAGKVDPEEIKLYGHHIDAGGILKSQWPSSFVPIFSTINQHDNKEYCLFGIDPVNRLILIMDPSLFGADGSNPNVIIYPNLYHNRHNYTDPNSANSKFLNNFIAWMAKVAVEGESFLKDFY